MKKGFDDDIVVQQQQEEFKPQVYTNTRENRGSFMAQLNALIYKNTVIQMRQRKTNVLQILLVVIIVGLACWLCGLTPAPNEDSYTTQIYPYVQWDGEYTYYCGGSNPTCTGYFPTAFYDLSGQAGELTNATGGPKSGLLGNVVQYPAQFTQCLSYSNCSSTYVLSPFFEPFSSSSALDDYLIQQIVYNEDNYICCSATPTVPTGALTINTLDISNLSMSYDMQLQDSENYNIYYPDNSNAIGQNLDENYPSFYLQLISNAFLKTAFPNINATIVGSEYNLAGNLTYSYYSANPLISFCIIPPAFCFLLPVFVFAIVLDRSNKTLELNKLMRLRMSAYWISYLIIDIIFYCIPLALVVLLGVAFRQWFITKSFGPTIVLFILWGFAQISLGFFLSTLFTKERVATVFSYVFILITLAAGMVLNLLVFTTGQRAPGWYMWLPPFTFLRGFYLIQSSFINLPAIKFSNMSLDNEMWTVYILLIAQSFILFLLAFYLEQVIPRSWGISRSPLFPIKDTIAWIKSKTAKKGETTRLMPVVEEQISCTSNEMDVRQEADNAMNGRENYILKCVGLTKQYEKKGKTALDNFFLALPERECFGLLGPNGAGKTTLISILSGTIPASSGYAVIDGETTKGDNQTSRNVIGICPQFDILWDDLTVVEHLRYYFKMKGIPRGQKLHVLVSNLTDHVGLQDHLNKRARDLSGGMKRKLSIAISLCGNPKLLLLDEPTTGLDPEARRDIWDIIQDAREGRSTIITTHNMEEADVLCTRIGIMANGTMKCIGNQQHLKSKYGAGYSLSITARTFEHLAEIQRWIKSLYPHATLDSNYGTNLNYLIAAEHMNISDLFNRMRLYKDTYGIQEWGINQTSLEEVFLKIVRASEGGEACQEV